MPKPRNPSKVKPLRTMKIFCEGEKTEPLYLRGYLSIVSGARRKAVIEIQKTRKNTPVQLVDEAIKAKRSPQALPEDEFWVVYDRESPFKYSDALHAHAYDAAMREGINIAISNICFEYWILLHFIDTSAAYTCYDDLRNRSVLKSSFFEATGKDYDKSSDLVFDAVRGGITDARVRGARVNSASLAAAQLRRARPYHLNPFVGMVDLLSAIDNFD